MPWKKLEENVNDFIDGEYLPHGATIQDPEKMSGADRTAILEHWQRRQALGQVPLQFRQISEGGRMIPPRYDRHLRAPSPSNCVALHTALPQIVGDSGAEDEPTNLDDYGIYSDSGEIGRAHV